jgi:hypothetical protein
MFQGRLHPEHHRSQTTMTITTQRPRATGPHLFRRGLAIVILCTNLTLSLRAQTPSPTGPQALTFSGLRAGPNFQSQINAIAIAPLGNLYLLIDQQDGVRLLETDPTASTLLAQTQLGAAGDIGLALALDSAGNMYLTGTTRSGQLVATAGSAFTTAPSNALTSFVAKFDSNLHTLFVTFTGGSQIAASSIAATSDAVFLTGPIFNATLPVTPTAAIQAPANGTTQNGFVEKFSSDGSRLLYATYLSGSGGTTTPSSIAADSADNAYIVGTTTAPGYPTAAALVPQMLGPTSGFLTRLSPAGDTLLFSTFIPGAGITSVALDPASSNLLLSGSIAPSQFPITSVASPIVNLPYQSFARIAFDGSAVFSSSLLAPGTQSFVTPGPSSTAWIAGNLTLPLLPLTPLSTIGDSFAIHINATNLIDQTARLGGIATSNPTHATADVILTSLATDATGNPTFAGSFQTSATQSLLATETFDLPLVNAPTSAFPSSVRSSVLPPSACSGSLCPSSASYLARLSIPTNAPSDSLALSTDDAPNLTLRNLGATPATALDIAVTGFTSATNCGTLLPAGGECSIALTGTGPGSISISAANAPTQTQSLPTPSTTTSPLAIVFSPKELDFGVVSSASGTIARTITVTNLSAQTQTFLSALDSTAQTLPYTLTESASDCIPAGISTKLLAPGASCHITLGLAASNSPLNDGPIHQNWLIRTRDLQLTAYTQAAALTLSSSEIDFGTLYPNGLRSPRYLYLSNNSTLPVEHTTVTLPPTSPFSLTDACPDTLEPFTVCQLKLTYQPTHTPSSDSTTLSLDQNLTALITGTALPQPAATLTPSLSLSATSINFPTPVPVTGLSNTPQTLTLQNTAASPIPLAFTLTGDFTDTTSCAASLAPSTSCKIIVTFAPSQPGTRNGLLTLTSGAGAAYINISGTSTPILSPTNNGSLNFGTVIVGEPSIQWFKITQPFPSLTLATSVPYTATLVEDLGFGHGQPPASAFSTNLTATCFNCWLGIRFLPPTTSIQTNTLTLAATGNPYLLLLTGTGTPATGLLLTPVAQDFGPIPVNSASPPTLFTLTNLTGAPVTIAPPSLTGDFTLSTLPAGREPCSGTLAYTASCFVQIAFTPTLPGPRTGTLTLQAGSTTNTATVTGFGSPDPGLALNPAALIFNSGPASTQQSITLTNTSTAPEQIAPPSTSSATFSSTSTCTMLAPAATCSIAITFTPASAPTTATLTIPVTANPAGTPIFTNYTVPLTATYTTQTTGLQIIPSDTHYGPQSISTLSPPRQLTINNLTAKSVALNLNLPRQFVLQSPPCTTLAPNAGCTFSLSFLALTDGDITGTLFANAIPSDGSAPLNGIAYVEGYGIGTAALSITGPLQPGNILNFGQLASGQSTQRTLTLTNSSATTALTVRSITSPWPFLATTTCGTTLALSATCTVTLSYTPVNQVTAGSNPAPSTTDTNTLLIESDAASSPDLINLTGSSTPITVPSPSNTATQPILSTSQNSLTFASSSPQTITLPNTGNATLNLSAFQTTPDFTLASTCSTLLPNATCNLTVTFTPQNASNPSPRIGAIEISSSASTPLEFISLLGVPALTAPTALIASPTSLDFGPVLLNTSSTLTVQLTNPGALPASLFSHATTGDYTASNGTCPGPGNPIPAATTCTLQIAFTPTQSGTRAGTLSIASSTTAQPLTIALTGIGYLPASFTLTVNGAASASSTVKTGTSATYQLTVTPLNNFTGSVSLTCTPIAPAAYAACTIAPANVTLAASAQNAVATITTGSDIGHNSTPPTRTRSQVVLFCLIVPAIFARTKRKHAAQPTLWTLLASIALLSAIACGSSRITPIPRAAPGNYQYQVTATSTASGTPITQTVTLNLIVQ